MMSKRIDAPATMTTSEHTLTGHLGDVTGVSFSQKYLASSSSDKLVRLWQVSDLSKPPVTLTGHSYGIHGCSFNSNGTVLASWSTDGRCTLWETETGKVLGSLQHPSRSCIRSACFSKNGRLLATGGDDEKLCLWDLTNYSLIRSLDGPEASIVCVAITPHSDLILAGSTIGDLRVWDAMFGYMRSMAMQYEAHDMGVACVAISPTYGSGSMASLHGVGQVSYLAASGGFDNILKLWDILTQHGSAVVEIRLRSTLRGHGGSVLTCCFSPSGSYLASGSEDKTVRLWDPFSSVPLHTIDGHTRYVTCCAFNEDGALLATGSNDRQVMVWRLQKQTDFSVNGTQQSVSDTSVKKLVRHWSVEDVCSWLRNAGMSQYCNSFRQNAIDGAEFVGLDDSTLQSSLGVGALGHRNKILRFVTESQNETLTKDKGDKEVPHEYLCPISQEIMRDPVIAADGFTYERDDIMRWIQRGNMTSPVTNEKLTSTQLTPNRSLKTLVLQYLGTTQL